MPKYIDPSKIRLTALGNIKVITAEGWHIRADDYRTIKKKYTGELK